LTGSHINRLRAPQQAPDEWRYADVQAAEGNLRRAIPTHTGRSDGSRQAVSPRTPEIPAATGRTNRRRTVASDRNERSRAAERARALIERVFPHPTSPVGSAAETAELTEMRGELAPSSSASPVIAPGGRRLLHVVALERACMHALGRRGLVRLYPSEDGEARPIGREVTADRSQALRGGAPEMADVATPQPIGQAVHNSETEPSPWVLEVGARENRIESGQSPKQASFQAFDPTTVTWRASQHKRSNTKHWLSNDYDSAVTGISSRRSNNGRSRNRRISRRNDVISARRFYRPIRQGSDTSSSLKVEQSR